MKHAFVRLVTCWMSETSRHIFHDFWRSLQQDLRRRPSLSAIGQSPYKLQIGCGKKLKPGWVNIDLKPPAELQVDVRRGLPLPDASCELIYCEHFLEHLEYPKESVPFLKECRRVLAPGGQIHIGVPDSRYVVEACMHDPIDPEFLERARRHDWGYPESCHTGFEYINYHFRLNGRHKFAFDETTLHAQLARVGFRNIRRRSFDPELDSEGRAEGTIYVVAE